MADSNDTWERAGPNKDESSRKGGFPRDGDRRRDDRDGGDRRRDDRREGGDRRPAFGGDRDRADRRERETPKEGTRRFESDDAPRGDGALRGDGFRAFGGGRRDRSGERGERREGGDRDRRGDRDRDSRPAGPPAGGDDKDNRFRRLVDEERKEGGHSNPFDRSERGERGERGERREDRGDRGDRGDRRRDDRGDRPGPAPLPAGETRRFIADEDDDNPRPVTKDFGGAFGGRRGERGGERDEAAYSAFGSGRRGGDREGGAGAAPGGGPAPASGERYNPFRKADEAAPALAPEQRRDFSGFGAAAPAGSSAFGSMRKDRDGAPGAEGGAPPQREMPAAFQNMGMRRLPPGADAGAPGGGMGGPRQFSAAFGGGMGGGSRPSHYDNENSAFGGGRRMGGGMGGGPAEPYNPFKKPGDGSSGGAYSPFGKSSSAGGASTGTSMLPGKAKNIMEFAVKTDKKGGAGASSGSAAAGAGSSSSGAGTEVDAAAAAVAKAASSMDAGVAMATLSKNLFKVVTEDYIGGFSTGKDAEKKICTAVKAMASSPQFAAAIVRLLAVKAVDCEKTGERKQVATLIHALRNFKPAAVLSNANINEGLEAAIASVAANAETGEVDFASAAEPVIRLRHLVEELVKSAGAKSKPTYGEEDLPEETVRRFLQSGPTSVEKPKLTEEDLKALALDDEAGMAAWGDEAAGGAIGAAPVALKKATAAAPAPAPAAAKPAAAPAAAPAAPVPAPTRPASEVAEELVASGLQGEALAVKAKESFAGYPPRVAVGALLTAVLRWAVADSRKDAQMKADCPFLESTAYGAALAHYSAKSIDAAVGLLYALQAFHSNVGLAKGMLPNIMMQLYQNDVLGEEAFFAWRDDTIDRSTPGKEKALQQSSQFFDYLEQSDNEDEDDEEDEDNEVNAALKGVPKPNNSSRL